MIVSAVIHDHDPPLLPSTVTPPMIDTQPSDQCVPMTLSAVFDVVASGEGVLTYQWFGPSGQLADSPGKIEGSDDEHLVILNVVMDDEGDYHVVVTNNFGGMVTSSMASLEICKLYLLRVLI